MIYSSLALLKTILQKFIQKEKGFEKFRSPSEFQEQFDQALETHQRTTSNAVVAVVRRDAADTGQAAVPAIAAVKTVGVLKIALGHPNHRKDKFFKLFFLKSAPADNFSGGSADATSAHPPQPKARSFFFSDFAESKCENKP